MRRFLRDCSVQDAMYSAGKTSASLELALPGHVPILRRDFRRDHRATRADLVQRLAALGVIHAAPHPAAESPGAEADLAAAVARHAEWSSFHGRAPPPASKPPLITSRSGVRRNSVANAGTAFVIKSEKRVEASASRPASTSWTATCWAVGAKSAPFSAMSDCRAASRP